MIIAYGLIITIFILIIMFLYKILNTNNYNLNTYYKKGTYVIVFGGSQGIGYSLATEFYKLGYNIILISRSTSNLIKAKDSIIASNPNIKNVEILYYTIDLSLITKDNVNSILSDFDKYLNSKEISIVIYNAGIRAETQFHLEDNNSINNMINVNCISSEVFNIFFTNKFKKDNNNYKKCIITLGSVSTINPTPKYELYGATKLFQTISLLNRSDNNIDYVVFSPSYVNTRVNKKLGALKRILSISPESCVESMIKYLGKRSYIIGHIKHEIFGLILHIIPKRLLTYF